MPYCLPRMDLWPNQKISPEVISHLPAQCDLYLDSGDGSRKLVAFYIFLQKLTRHYLGEEVGAGYYTM